MVKQTIRHREQKDEEQPPIQVGSTPAPMVERAFRLLDVLSTSKSGLTLSELARALDMSKGSMHGLLKTLERSSVIEQHEDRLYTLGPKIYDLAQKYVHSAGLLRFAVPAMHRLANSIGETIFLGHVEREHVRIIESVQADSGPPSLRVSASRGTRVHLLAGATGRLVLASWPPKQREAFLHSHSLPHFTEHSITDPEHFLAAIEETTRTGIGEDYEEYLSGINAVATGIYGPDGTLVALLWIVGFSSRFTGDVMKQAGQQLQREAIMISESLGNRSIL